MSTARIERFSFNFLMSDGEHLIAYGHDRLHHFQRRDVTASGKPAREIALIATEPLTGEEGWLPFERGELRIYRLGRLIEQIKTAPAGPNSKGPNSESQMRRDLDS